MSRGSWETQQSDSTSPKWILTVLLVLVVLLTIIGLLFAVGGQRLAFIQVYNEPHASQHFQSSALNTFRLASTEDSDKFQFSESVQNHTRLSSLRALVEDKDLAQRLASQMSGLLIKETTLVMIVSANGVQLEGSPAILASDFELDTGSSADLIKPEELFSTMEDIASRLTNLVVVFECGQAVFDPRIRIHKNAFPEALIASWEDYVDQIPEESKQHWRKILLIVSNRANQLNAVNLRSRHSLFAESLLLGLLGKADGIVDESDADGDVTLLELYAYLHARCDIKSRGTLTPILVDHQGELPLKQALKKDELNFTVAKATLDSQANEPAEDQKQEEPPEKQPDEPLEILAGNFEDLFEAWEDVAGHIGWDAPQNGSESENAEPEVEDQLAWLAIDYAPQLLKRRATRLVTSQHQALNGIDNSFSKRWDQDQLEFHRKDLEREVIEGRSETFLANKQEYYRALFIASELSILAAKLSTFSDIATDLDQALQDFQVDVENLASHLRLAAADQDFQNSNSSIREKLEQIRSNSLPAVVSESLLSELNDVPLDISGVHRCLLECIVLPLAQRKELYSLIPSQVTPVDDLVDSEKASHRDRFRSLVSRADRSPTSGTVPDASESWESLLEIANQGSNYEPHEFYELVRKANETDGDTLSQILRLVDGRDAYEQLRDLPPGHIFHVPPGKVAEISIVGSRKSVVFDRLAVPIERELTVENLTDNIQAKLKHSANDQFDAELSVETAQGPASKGPFDPQTTKFKILLTAKAYSPPDAPRASYPLVFEVFDTQGSPRGSQRLDVLLPRAPRVELKVGGTDFDSDFITELQPFPNREMRFDFQVRHRSRNPRDLKSFQLEVFAVSRDQRASWRMFAFDRDILPEVVRSLRKRSLGKWSATNLEPEQWGRFTSQSTTPAEETSDPSGANDEKDPAANWRDVDQGLQLVLTEMDGSNFRQEYWVGFDIQEPEEYVQESSRFGPDTATLNLELKDNWMNRRISAGVQAKFYNTAYYSSKDGVRNVTLYPDQPEAEASVSARSSADWVAVDVDQYPRAFQWNGGQGLGLRSIIYTSEGKEPETLDLWQRNDETPVYIDGIHLESMEVVTCLDFPGDFTNDAHRVTIGMESQELFSRIGDRDQQIGVQLLAEPELELLVNTRVRDHRIKIPLPDTQDKSLVLRDHNDELRIPIHFDLDEPELELVQSAVSVEIGQEIEITVKIKEENPKRLVVGYKPTEGDKWEALVNDLGPSALNRKTVSFKPKRNLEVGSYDIQLKLFDQVGRDFTLGPLTEFIQVRPKRKVVRPRKKDSKPKLPTLEGQVQFVVVKGPNGSPKDVRATVTFKGVSGKTSPPETLSGPSFSYQISEPGELQIRVDQNIDGPRYAANEKIEVKSAEDLEKVHEVVVKRIQ